MAYRLAVLFSSLCHSRAADSSAAPAEPDAPRASPPVLQPAAPLVLEQAARLVSLPDVPPVLARAPVSRLDVLPVLALVWLQDVDALPAFQVERAESGLTQAVPAPVSPLAAQLPAFPLAWHSVFRSVAHQDVRPALSPVVPVPVSLAPVQV